MHVYVLPELPQQTDIINALGFRLLSIVVLKIIVYEFSAKYIRGYKADAISFYCTLKEVSELWSLSKATILAPYCIPQCILGRGLLGLSGVCVKLRCLLVSFMRLNDKHCDFTELGFTLL